MCLAILLVSVHARKLLSLTWWPSPTHRPSRMWETVLAVLMGWPLWAHRFSAGNPVLEALVLVPAGHLLLRPSMRSLQCSVHSTSQLGLTVAVFHSGCAEWIAACLCQQSLGLSCLYLPAVIFPALFARFYGGSPCFCLWT